MTLNAPIDAVALGIGRVVIAACIGTAAYFVLVGAIHVLQVLITERLYDKPQLPWRAP